MIFIFIRNKETLLNKTIGASIAWIVSHCKTHSKRESYVEVGKTRLGNSIFWSFDQALKNQPWLNHCCGSLKRSTLIKLLLLILKKRSTASELILLIFKKDRKGGSIFFTIKLIFQLQKRLIRSKNQWSNSQPWIKTYPVGCVIFLRLKSWSG